MVWEGGKGIEVYMRVLGERLMKLIRMIWFYSPGMEISLTCSWTLNRE